MLEVGRGINCEDCIDRNSVTLIALARQYVAGDHWLKNPGNRMQGDYSFLAIHAIGRRINTDRPYPDIRGPFLRNDPDIEGDENRLFELRAAITAGTLDTDAVQILREIARRRQHSLNVFINKGQRHWESEAAKAKPFLDRMSYRDRSESTELRERFQRVYWLDQGAFILAKSALGRCGGPWFRMCPFGEKYQRFHPPFTPNS